MTTAVPQKDLFEFSWYISRRLGLHFPEERQVDLQRHLIEITRTFRFETPQACLDWILNGSLKRSDIDILAGLLTIGETFFYRDDRSFEALENHILPELIRKRRKSRSLRIWSAGCSSGEEPYTIAILLRRLIPDIHLWNIHILATDINPLVLEKARQGIYGDWSFRGVPDWFQDRYFTRQDGGRYAILPVIRDMVTLEYLNLAEDAFPSLVNRTSGLDIIYCRNVMMYFDEDRFRQTVASFHQCLVIGGWLIVGAAETSHYLFPQFQSVRYADRTAYKRVGGTPEQRPDTIDIPSLRLPEISSPQKISQLPEIAPPLETHDTPAPIPSPEPAQIDEPALLVVLQELYDRGSYGQVVRLAQEKGNGQLGQAPILILIGKAFANQGLLDNALEWSLKAVEADKVDPACHYLQASILLELGRLDEAHRAFQNVLYLEPGFILAGYALGSLLRKQNRISEAGRHFRNTLKQLERYPAEDLIPGSDGLTAGRLRDIIQVTIRKETSR